MQTPLTPEFTFAGFSWPRYVASLPHEPLHKRLAEWKKHRSLHPHTSGYYHKPTPTSTGKGFYLCEGCGPFELRWQWCDEVEGVRIGHTGWFCDEYQDDKIRGIVLTLSHGRGFLAGWSMGEGMVSEVDYHVYDEARDAAYAADSEAERVAEAEREHREEQEVEPDEGDESEEGTHL